MKQWIEENKYVATLLGITLVISGILVGLIVYITLDKAKVEKSIASKSNSIKTIKSTYGKLDADSVEKYSGEINEGVESAIKLHGNLTPNKNELNETLSSTDFRARLTKYIASSKNILKKGNVSFPKGTMFGFEKYREKLIKGNPKAIGLCLYQIESFRYIIKNLAKQESAKLLRFNRAVLVEEEQKETKDPTTFPAARRMRFDLVLELTEPQLNTLLKDLTNTKEYLFIPLAVSAINESPTPIKTPGFMLGENEQSENSSKSTASNDDLSMFENSEMDEMSKTDGMDKMDEMSKPKNRKITEFEEPEGIIINQVLGNEKVKVAIALELVKITDIDKLNIKRAK